MLANLCAIASQRYFKIEVPKGFQNVETFTHTTSDLYKANMQEHIGDRDDTTNVGSPDMPAGKKGGSKRIH